MATSSVADRRHESTLRAQRALDLYRDHGKKIQILGEDLFEVPSCTGRKVYRVRYGGEVEACECPDFQFGHTCKHLLAVGIMYAARRGGVREVRSVRVVASDPIAYGAKRKSCPACFGGYLTITTEADGQHQDEAVPCRRCHGETA